jgi:glycosyltransferase involved in cell wall biosynthesis
MVLADSVRATTFEPGIETASTVPSVLQIGLESPWGRSGGLNRYFAELVGALRAIGMQVTAVVTGEQAGGLEGQPWFRVVASEASSVLTRLISIRREVYRLKGQVDLVDAHFALSGFAALGGPLRGRPLVVHFQGPWAEESAAIGQQSLRCGVKRWMERRVYRRASGFVVLSRSFRRVLLERYGVVPWDVVVMAPGVDTDRFRPGDRAEARAALGVPPGAWVAVAVRRLVPRMGLDVLLDAWRAVVAAADVPVLLLVAGDGPSRPALEAQVERLGLTEYVQFIGRVDDASLVSAYRAADVSVVPSVALEGYGLVVLESLATGTPVVASAVGGLSEAVGNFDEGSLVPPGDPEALAERLIGAMHDVKPLPLASACRRYAEGFSWTEVAQRHADLYRRVLRREASLTGKGEAGEDRPLRVVVVGHTAQLSGGELAISRLIASITNAVDVHVVLAEYGPLVDVLERAGATVEILPMEKRARDLRRDRVRIGGMPFRSMLATATYTVKLARRLRRLQPDLVHTNTLKAALYGGVAARAAGVPCLWHVRDRIVEDYLPRSAVTLIRVAARFLPTEIVANSRTTLATLHLQERQWGRAVYDGVATVVPSPVELIDRDSERSQTSKDRFRVAMVGRLSPWKGQDVFLRAFAEAFGGGSEEAVLVGSAMFGEEEYEEALVELVADLGIGDRVEFRGFRTDIWTELDRVDTMIHASVIPEPFGQVVVEGMAARLAVVAADAGGPAEIITHEVDGLLYPPGDVAALAVLLRRLADDPTLRFRLGDQAVITAEKYGIANVAAQFGEVYQRIGRQQVGRSRY